MFSCNSEPKSNESEGEDIEVFTPENEQDLTSYEYICDHCHIGSHEPGTCACGMEYEKNPDFIAKAE